MIGQSRSFCAKNRGSRRFSTAPTAQKKVIKKLAAREGPNFSPGRAEFQTRRVSARLSLLVRASPLRAAQPSDSSQQFPESLHFPRWQTTCLGRSFLQQKTA